MHTRSARALSLSIGLVLGAAPALAGNGGDEWLTLDRELEAFSRARQPAQGDGVNLGLLVRSSYAQFEETPTPLVSDYAGFALDNVRAWVEGEVAGGTLHVSMEGLSGTALLLDAWAALNLTEDVRVSVGQFQPAVLRSSLVQPQNQLFILRTTPGAFWEARDSGAEVAAQLDTVLLRASLLNGRDAAGDQLAVAVRADWSAVGGGVPLVEGTYGSGRQTCLSVGASYFDDPNALLDGQVLSADAVLTTDRFSLAAEVQHYGNDGGVPTPGNPDVKNGIYANLSDANPWAATAAFMIDPEKYEFGARYEMLDDQHDGKALTLGINRYMAGHDMMWQVNFAKVQSGGATKDGTVFGIGLTVNV